jgi:hypothetical protein
MLKRSLFAVLAMLSLGLYGCQTSCADDSEPVAWADGITSVDKNGHRVYQTTAVDDAWLHFPSHRAFRLHHGFGTKNIGVDAWVSFEEKPVGRGTSEPPADFAIVSGNVLTVTDVTDNEIVVENSTCENDYYMLVRITDLGE